MIILAQRSANAAADAVLALCDGGVLQIYDGVKPESPEIAARSQHLLAELRFGSPAFSPAVNGTAMARAISKDPAARVTGSPTWFRVVSAEGRAVMDGSVGTMDGDLVTNLSTIQRDAEVSIERLAYVQPRSTREGR